jgi:hypothetical protein
VPGICVQELPPLLEIYIPVTGAVAIITLSILYGSHDTDAALLTPAGKITSFQERPKSCDKYNLVLYKAYDLIGIFLTISSFII